MAALVWISAAALAACGRSGAPGPDEVVHKVTPGAAAADSAAAGATSGPGDADAAAPAPRYPLRLINPGRRDAIVFASAHAGEVVLDTVPAGDSTRVTVAVRADTLLLRAAAAQDTGAAIARRSLRLRIGSGARWVIRDSGAAAASATTDE